jgi:hypothetical protein
MVLVAPRTRAPLTIARGANDDIERSPAPFAVPGEAKCHGQVAAKLFVSAAFAKNCVCQR